MKIHRAVTLALMMLVSVALVAAATWQGVQSWNGRSLAALAVVVVAAAISGIAFSWKRYFGK
ncbi:MAG: hypothetical protein E6I08_11535 [Chloroflexi bacterium]|nr:MAG: hypothetical protein E6I08_11535 [Chloroflexota bacterium]